MKNNIDKQVINTIRMLAVDAVQAANSGHPGLPLGLAEPLYYLYKNHLRFNSKHASWINRDRFILSPGHGSALLYAINHLAGYKISLDDLKNFRQINHLTAGHPEIDIEAGIEMTTGPLGQGGATSVGMAIAEKYLNYLFKYLKDNRASLLDHYTYCVVSDGDLQEGISHEAMSLAGRLRLNKLIFLFDSNDIQLDTPTAITTNDNYKNRALCYNWNYILVDDPYNETNINNAINQAKKSDKPTFIELKTVIGKDSALAHSPKVHGAPFNQVDYLALKKSLGFEDKYFYISQEVKDYCKQIFQDDKINLIYAHDAKKISASADDNTEMYSLFHSFSDGEHLFDFSNLAKKVKLNEPVATRNGSKKVLDFLVDFPFLLSGSADLSGSTMITGAQGVFDANNLKGQEIKYGVREFAMGAIGNGIVLHSNLKSIVATFLIFSDYLKPSLRLAALMHTPSIFCFSHDSVFLGEDGPTHQPIEQLAMLRSIPNVNVFRPCNDEEIVAAYNLAFQSKKTPSVIVTSRQKINGVANTSYEKGLKGGYIVEQFNDSAPKKLTIVATGSEVPVAIEVAQKVADNDKNMAVDVVSMLSYELFKQQDNSYQNKVLYNADFIVNIEASASFGRYFEKTIPQLIIGIDTFGVSANLNDIIAHFKFDSNSIFHKVNKFLNDINKGAEK